VIVDFAYGSARRSVELPGSRTTVVAPRCPAPVGDPGQALRDALRQPIGSQRLRSLVRRGDTVAIAVCDGTRPQPRQLVLPALLEELDGLVRDQDITILVATGTHRPNTPDELEAMIGREVLGRVNVVNHTAHLEHSLAWVGRTSTGVPIWINRQWLTASVRITTGFIEPHFFAGFSGGPKLVAPGLAGLDTVFALHDARRISDPRATWGITDENPIQTDIREIAHLVGVHFSMDVVLDSNQRIIFALAGDLRQMHERGCELARTIAMCPVDQPFDLVVTSNGGFPLDQNLYQCVKGMSAAAQVVRPGGTIVCLAECRDGFPDHGMFRARLVSSRSPAELLGSITEGRATQMDQWQLQILAKILLKAKVVMSTSFLGDEELKQSHLGHTANVSELARTLGEGASVCALPEGPQTIPYLSEARGAPGASSA
jgi:lactate racemase